MSDDRTMEIADAAVVLHLVRLIQDSPDVRHHVGGFGTKMRDLLVASLKARDIEDPLEVLRPAPHRADDEPRVKMLERQLDEVRAAARALLKSGTTVACDEREHLRELV